MSLIEYEGRQIELPNEITSNDEKLLEVLLPYFPELSEATIERKTGQPIKIQYGLLKAWEDLKLQKQEDSFLCQYLCV
ncbi:hypothetical protein [Lyngbya sp. CCAP 1446/10]|uniref:hypothetical protein n=1 Tax=Lyngbya sp. CCAP 1446/10 TaxID=439293 RepID=UPI0022380221|nr:hypothetical protein [Lyngbya sp. CCAP 1446/10]